MSYYVYIQCCNDVQIVEVQNGKSVVFTIYIGVCSSLVARLLWQQVTSLAAVMTHCGLSKLDLFWNYLCICGIWGKYVSLIWSYIWQEDRKCSSVSTSFCRQCAHSLLSLESQFCLLRPLSIARPYSLSLYIVKAFLNFGAVTVVRYYATVYPLFRAQKHSSFLYFGKLFPCQVTFLFSHAVVGANCAVVLGLCRGCLCLWTEPQDQLV